MIQIVGIIIFSCLATFGAFSQCGDSTILLDKIHELCDESSSWSYNTLDYKVVLTYKGNFTTNTTINPLAVTKKELKKPNANSISFEFVTAHGWADSTYIQTKNNNAYSLQALKEQYISHYDSIGWPPRHSRSIFESNPMRYLKRFNRKSEDIFSSMVRLPDFRIRECGVWIESSLDLTTFYIVQWTVREEIDKMISRIVSLDIYVNQALDSEENY